MLSLTCDICGSCILTYEKHNHYYASLQDDHMFARSLRCSITSVFSDSGYFEPVKVKGGQSDLWSILRFCDIQHQYDLADVLSASGNVYVSVKS